MKDPDPDKSKLIDSERSITDDVYIEINLRGETENVRRAEPQKEPSPKTLDQMTKVLNILYIVLANRVSQRCEKQLLSSRILSFLPPHLQKQFRMELIDDGRTLFNSLSMLISWWKNLHRVIASKTLENYHSFFRTLTNSEGKSILSEYFHKKQPKYILFCDYIGLLLCLLRGLGLKARLVIPIFNKFKSISLKTKESLIYWLEVYSTFNNKWIIIDCQNATIDCKVNLIQSINSQVHKNCLAKVVALDRNGILTDVTQNYFPSVHCNKVTNDLINGLVEDLKFTLNSSLPDPGQDLKKFDTSELESLLYPSAKLPQDKFILKSKIPKYDIIRPEKIAGYFKGEPVYLKSSLVKVRSKESWFTNYGRIIKEEESPVKVIELKNSKKNTTKLQHLYGEWQTKLFVPPAAQDGIVPKNKYGNVDLFNMKMLPEGCVYIENDDADKIAKDLNIDFAFACTRFAFSGGARAIPNIKGIVICKEFESIILEKLSQHRRKAPSPANEINDQFSFFKKKRIGSKHINRSVATDEINSCFMDSTKGENPFD